MRGFLLRVMKSAVPTALLLAVCGYLLANGAAAVAATQMDDGTALREMLTARLPLVLAGWGGGLVVVFELFRALWVKPKPPEPAKPAADDAETLLLKLLAEAEAAEAARLAEIPLPAVSVGVSVTEQTPPPRGEPLPLTELDFPLPESPS